jgi:hypothetical protein
MPHYQEEEERIVAERARGHGRAPIRPHVSSSLSLGWFVWRWNYGWRRM